MTESAVRTFRVQCEEQINVFLQVLVQEQIPLNGVIFLHLTVQKNFEQTTLQSLPVDFC